MLDSANSLNSENNSNNNLNNPASRSSPPSAKKMKGTNKGSSSMHRFWSDAVSHEVQPDVSARSSND